MDNEQARRALRLFVMTVEATGGVKTDAKGFIVPVADEDWLDLGDAYLEACEALGQKPMLKEDDAGEA